MYGEFFIPLMATKQIYWKYNRQQITKGDAVIKKEKRKVSESAGSHFSEQIKSADRAFTGSRPGTFIENWVKHSHFSYLQT